MTDKKKFKARVRERMATTGESYMTAKRNLESGLGTMPTSQDPSSTTTTTALSADVPSPSSNMSGGFAENRRRFRHQALDEWRKVTEDLAGARSTLSWTSATEIANILNQVARKAPRNHTLFPPPNAGGLDLTSASMSREAGCIELHFDASTTIVRPLSLQLNVPERDPLREWAYFRLETGTLAPSGVYAKPSDQEEEFVLELRPGEYVDSDSWEVGYHGYDEDGEPLPLPQSARLISRCFRGTFLIVAKGSTYLTLDRYVGEHAAISAAEFRSAIESLIAHMHQKGTYGRDVLLGD